MNWWPWTQLERLQFDNMVLREGLEKSQATSMELRAADTFLRQRIKELEAAQKPKSPEGEFKACDCGSHAFITQAHLIGWTEGDRNMLPFPLGALAMCRNCRTLWEIDDRGMHRVKPAGQPPPDKEKRKKPNDDTDLAWKAGR